MTWLFLILACAGSEPTNVPSTPVQPPAPKVEAPVEPPAVEAPVEADEVPESTLSEGHGNDGQGSTGKAQPKERESKDPDAKTVGSAGPKTRSSEPAKVEEPNAATAADKAAPGEPAVNK